MSDLPCSTVRRWLQAPDALAIIDARHMDRHLTECEACDAYRRGQIDMDRLIVGALQAGVGDTRLHEAVRARLLAEQQSPASRPKRRFFSRPWSVFRPALILAPVAIAAAVVLAIFSPLLDKHGQVTPVSAAWHLSRPTIGFPLTLDPRDPQHILVGAWGQVYQSWNAGQTWQAVGRLPGGLVIRDVAADRVHPNRYLVATMHSVLITNDAGRHWTTTAAYLRGAENMFLMQDPARAQTFYVGPSVLWRSDDGGSTWRPDGSGTIFAPNGIQSLVVARDGALYTGIWGGGVAVSHDGGVTWQRRARGLNRDVLSVSIGSGGRLWAATKRGVYTSSGAGRTWQRRSPSHLFATAVTETGDGVVAGGDGAVYRSTDGGLHWARSQSGLPLEPYVYSLTTDPQHPGRIYASLNGDGIFRSDDGGQTWQEMNAGLPISLQEGKASPVLFLRDGEPWLTDSAGSDPGNVTFETRVHRAALTSDGAAVAYVVSTSNGWAVRIVSAGGSRVRTVMTGSGALPNRLLWSPTGTHLVAVTRAVGITAADLSGHQTAWALTPPDHVLGWTKDGHGLLVWNAEHQRVEDRLIAAGQVAGGWPGTYASLPVRAPGTSTIAMVTGSALSIAPIGAPPRPVARTPGCRPTTWSDDGSRLLLACRGTMEIRSATGALVSRVTAPANARFAPNADRRIIYFSHGSMWAWTPKGGASVIVPHASPAG